MTKEEDKKFNKYCNCKLYKIISKTTPDKIFYGVSTDQLRKVLGSKKTKYKQFIINNNVCYCPSFELIKNNDAEILLIDKFKCDDIDDYNKYIYEYINNAEHPNINNYRPEGYKKPIRKRLYYEKLYNTDTDKQEINIIKKDIENIKKDTETISDIMNSIKHNIKGGNIKELEYKKDDNIKYLTFDKPINNIINNNNDINDKNEIKYIQLKKSHKAIKDYNNIFFSNNNPDLMGGLKNKFYEDTENDEDLYNKDFYIINGKKYDIIDNKYIKIDGIEVEKNKIDKFDLKNRKIEIKILEYQINSYKNMPDRYDNIYINDGQFNKKMYDKDFKEYNKKIKHQTALMRYEHD